MVLVKRHIIEALFQVLNLVHRARSKKIPLWLHERGGSFFLWFDTLRFLRSFRHFRSLWGTGFVRLVQFACHLVTSLMPTRTLNGRVFGHLEWPFYIVRLGQLNLIDLQILIHQEFAMGELALHFFKDLDSLWIHIKLLVHYRYFDLTHII